MMKLKECQNAYLIIERRLPNVYRMAKKVIFTNKTKDDLEANKMRNLISLRYIHTINPRATPITRQIPNPQSLCEGE